MVGTITAWGSKATVVAANCSPASSVAWAMHLATIAKMDLVNFIVQGVHLKCLRALCCAGASFVYRLGESARYERLEVRAFGLMLTDLLDRIQGAAAWADSPRLLGAQLLQWTRSGGGMSYPRKERASGKAERAVAELLRGVCGRCLDSDPAARPTFTTIAQLCSALSGALG